MKEDVLKGYKVGADDYLTKPFDSEVLLMKIHALFKEKQRSLSPTASSLNLNLTFLLKFETSILNL